MFQSMLRMASPEQSDHNTCYLLSVNCSTTVCIEGIKLTQNYENLDFNLKKNHHPAQFVLRSVQVLHTVCLHGEVRGGRRSDLSHLEEL